MSSVSRGVWPVVMIMSFALAHDPVLAQGTPRKAPVRIEADLDHWIAETASMEIVLVGVRGLTDAQRDSVEQLEQELRDTVAVHGGKILRAKRSVTAWWAAEQVMNEREVNAIVAARSQALDRLRTTLSVAQRPTFDHNTITVRDWDVQFWSGLARGQFSSSTINNATVP